MPPKSRELIYSSLFWISTCAAISGGLWDLLARFSRHQIVTVWVLLVTRKSIISPLTKPNSFISHEHHKDKCVLDDSGATCYYLKHLGKIGSIQAWFKIFTKGFLVLTTSWMLMATSWNKWPRSILIQCDAHKMNKGGYTVTTKSFTVYFTIPKA